MVLVSGAAFAYFFVHLESPGSQLRAKILEVDGLVLADPVPIPLSEKEPLQMHPAQRYGVEVCAVDPKGARRKPGRLIIRAQVDQFADATDDTNGMGLNGAPPCSPKTLGNCSIVAVASAVFDMVRRGVEGWVGGWGRWRGGERGERERREKFSFGGASVPPRRAKAEKRFPSSFFSLISPLPTATTTNENKNRASPPPASSRATSSPDGQTSRRRPTARSRAPCPRTRR